MKLLYVSGHRFIKCNNGDVYTTGQMGANYFSRFEESFDSITVIGYYENENEGNSSKKVEKINNDSSFLSYHLVEGSQINIIGQVFTTYKIRKAFRSLIKSHDKIATKAPSLIAPYVVKGSIEINKQVLVDMVGCPFDAYWNHSFLGKMVAPFMWGHTKYALRKTTHAMYVTNEFLQKRYPCDGKSIGCSDVSLPLVSERVLESRLYKIKNKNTNEPIIIGTIGAVDVKYKGQGYIIKALSRLHKEGIKFEYHLVGGGSQKKLKRMAREHGVEKNIKFLGTIKHDDIFKFLDSIDVYIQPSKTEGLPRALIEAMSRGCPCLGSNVGGIPELLKDNSVFEKGDNNGVYNLLLNMDTQRLINDAKNNFEKAKEYESSVLKKKRKLFYESFKEDGYNEKNSSYRK